MIVAGRSTRRVSTGDYTEMSGSRDSSADSINATLEQTSRNSYSRPSQAPYGYSNEVSRVGAVAVTGGSQTGKQGPSVPVGSESYDGRQQQPGATSVAGRAPFGKSDIHNNSTSDARVGAVHMANAARSCGTKRKENIISSVCFGCC